MESVAGVMASASSERLLDSDDQLLECAICMDKFVDPCVLPCSHTFCRHCLIRHYEWCTTVREAEESDVIKCPACRQTCPLPADIRVDQLSPSAVREYWFNSAGINVSIPHPTCGSLVTANVNSFFKILISDFIYIV